jgi:O-antigen ligase
MFLQQPWFGYGLGFFASLTRDVFIANSHNDYLTRLLGGGIFGLAAFLLPFLAMMYYALRARRKTRDSDVRLEASVAFVACSVFMVMMGFNPIQEEFYLVPVTFAMFESAHRPDYGQSVVRLSMR